MKEKDIKIGMKVVYTKEKDYDLEYKKVYRIKKYDDGFDIATLYYINTDIIAGFAFIYNIKPVNSKVKRLPRNNSKKILFKLKKYLTKIKECVTILLEEGKEVI